MEFWQFTGFMPTEQVLPLARASERLGFEGLAIPDHLFYPREVTPSYPGTASGVPSWGPEAHWPDSWALASAVGAATTTLRCMSAVYIAPARDLFTVAKAISTAAVLTNGRVVAGLGAGWCREEFEQTGQAFSGRGQRMAEMIEGAPAPLGRRLGRAPRDLVRLRRRVDGARAARSDTDHHRRPQ